jgi:hypothetical protein
LQQRLAQFSFHEETPVQSVIGDCSVDEVFSEVIDILMDNDEKSILRALRFIRDASLYPHSYRDRVQEKLANSAVWKRLEELLHVPNVQIRSQTIYTVGKLSHRDRAHLLSEAFPFYLRSDPLNLPSLLLELHWLKTEWPWHLLECLAGARHYLQRWSLCSVSEHVHGDSATMDRFLGVFSPSATDSHALVAGEAKWQIERLKLARGPSLPKKQWRSEVRRVAQLQPRFTFDMLSARFMENRVEYNLAEVDGFLNGLSQN